jgi:NADPH-dependent 2,4-dienoyl-CoA reductase/sulfur reductase-like enzyme
MTGPLNRIVIVGASAGGLAAAEALRRSGYAGEVTLIGEEPHLPYDRPPLSKQLLAGQWDAEQLALRDKADIDTLGLDLRLGVPATGLSPGEHVVALGDGIAVGYDALIIATGVRARRLPGSEGIAGAHVLRTVEDALALEARLGPGRRLVIVGGGFVGAEVAGTARSLGADVVLLESGSVPLGQAVGEEAGRFLARYHHDHGVQVRTGAAVVEILSAGGAATGVRLADGSLIPADDVLVGIGGVPNTEWLAGSGLPVGDGLVCDEYCEAVPGVYGVGDVARWHNPLFGTSMRVEHRTNAAEQAMAVARNLLTPHDRRPFAPVPYVWSDQYGMRIQIHGYLRGHDEALVVESEVSQRRLLVAYRKDDKLVGVLAVGIAPKALRNWRGLIAAGSAWATAAAGAVAR